MENIIGELLSGLIGAILGAGISFLTLRFNYRDLYSRSVSANRMDWINNFREEIATIIAALECQETKTSKPAKDEDIIYQAYKARAKLQTRLNMDISKSGNEYNQVMSNLLQTIDFKKCSECDDKENLIEKLTTLTRKILLKMGNKTK